MFDFVISSEVFEHVPPPVERAFENVARLLKPSGVLIMTVPYSLESSMREHYPELHEFGFATVSGEQVLVNRNQAGEIRVFEHPVFHRSGNDTSLEVREFSETDLVALLRGAGFRDVKIYSENCPEFGIVHTEPCSLPIAARRGDFAFSRESAREVVEEWRGRETEARCRDAAAAAVVLVSDRAEAGVVLRSQAPPARVGVRRAILLPTRISFAVKRVDMSVDTARTSACATSLNQLLVDVGCRCDILDA